MASNRNQETTPSTQTGLDLRQRVPVAFTPTSLIKKLPVIWSRFTLDFFINTPFSRIRAAAETEIRSQIEQAGLELFEFERLELTFELPATVEEEGFSFSDFWTTANFLSVMRKFSASMDQDGEGAMEVDGEDAMQVDGDGSGSELNFTVEVRFEDLRNGHPIENWEEHRERWCP
ncbi:hypothetical protein H2203_008628 [Taxawa tesnikishii (nom. ined.)]|nr:hypothetical protein H2203_008628 [Dothideales sp. JES 119]